MTGKLADTVMSVRNGEQIARKYQPVVFNPSTPAQVAVRAKMKLMSQLSAILSPFIAMRRVGTVSARNLFVKKNFRLTSYSNGTASIELNGIQLAASSVALPPVVVARLENNEGIEAHIDSPRPEGIDHVVFVFLEKQADDKLRVMESVLAEEPATSGYFKAEVDNTSNSVVVLAYGIRVNSESARAIFSDLEAPSAETVAKLVATSSLTENDVTLTQTVGATLAAV